MSNEGVHRTHCCVIHGCKYGDEDCPVVNKKVLQEYLCESCDPWYEGDDSRKYTMEDIEEVFSAPQDVRQPLTILEKLHEIEARKCIYNIHYCKAGVGISFYYPDRHQTAQWRDAISTKAYHKDFEACIKAEYKIMLQEENEKYECRRIVEEE